MSVSIRTHNPVRRSVVAPEPLTNRFVLVNGIWRMKSAYQSSGRPPSAWDTFKSWTASIGNTAKEVITAPINIVNNAQKGLFRLGERALDRGSETVKSLGQSLSLPLVAGGLAALFLLSKR